MAEDTSKTGIESDEEEKRKAALARIASEIITDAQKSANGITAYTLKAAATSKLPDLQNLVPDALAIPKQETRVQTSNRASDNARRVISYCLDNVDSIRSIADSFNAARQSASAGARFKNWLDFGAKVIGLIVREPRSIVLGIDYLRGNISPDQILRDEKTWQLLANKKAQIGKAVELFKPEISAALQQFGAENLDVNAVVQAVISKPKELREIYTSFSDIGVIGQVREADAIYAELQRAGKLPASTVEQLPVLTKLQTLNELYNKAKLEGRSLFTNVESAEKFDKLNSWYEKLKLENRLVEVEVACAKKPAPGWMGLIKEAVDLTS